MLSFLNLLQDKSFHMLAITIGLFNGLYPENKVKDMEYPNTSPVSYTHLDVYKRQGTYSKLFGWCKNYWFNHSKDVYKRQIPNKLTELFQYH